MIVSRTGVYKTAVIGGRIGDVNHLVLCFLHLSEKACGQFRKEPPWTGLIPIPRNLVQWLINPEGPDF